MKTAIKSIVIVIAAAVSFNASADSVSHAATAFADANNQVNAVNAAAGRSFQNQQALDQHNRMAATAGAQRAQAAANLRSALQAAQNAASQGAQQQQAMSSLTASKMASAANPVGQAPSSQMPGVSQNPAGNPVSISAPKANPNKAATGSINVDSKSLNPNTPVNTPKGVVKAGDLPAGTQVSVPHVDAIIGSPSVKGGQSKSEHGRSGVGHDGRGSDNAHSHAFGGHGYGADNSRSEGFGGHSHFH